MFSAFPRRSIEQTLLSLTTAAGNPFTIRADRHTPDRILVTCETVQRSARIRVPQGDVVYLLVGVHFVIRAVRLGSLGFMFEVSILINS